MDKVKAFVVSYLYDDEFELDGDNKKAIQIIENDNWIEFPARALPLILKRYEQYINAEIKNENCN